MIVLKRKEGQWIEVVHRSGDVIRIRVCQIQPADVNVAFDDARNFEVVRPERDRRPAPADSARLRDPRED